MEENKKIEFIATIEKEIAKINNKENNIYFFVLDTKGVPSGSLAYIYETAYYLQEIGYQVKMLHIEDEFVGVGEWMGEKYAQIPHINSEKETVTLSFSDLLIVPEVFANVLNQTKLSPCKRVVLLQNFPYISEFMPVNAQWGDYKIMDAITTSNQLSNMLHEIFPYVKTKVVQPAIAPCFRDSDEPKEIGINIVCRNPNDFHKIVKPFYWSYPMYKFVSFYHLSGLPREVTADTMRKHPITIWWDVETGFGYAALEAIKSGSIVIGKRPDIIPEWMTEETEEGTRLLDNGIWFDSLPELYRIIASVVNTWLNDTVPEQLISEMKKTAEKYTVEENHRQIEEVYGGYINSRRIELVNLLGELEKENNNTKTE